MNKFRGKLTPELRVVARARAASGEKQRDIAQDLGVTQSAISQAVNGVSSAQKTVQLELNKDARRFRLPVAGADVPQQDCARLSARLSVYACAERSERADRGDDRRTFGGCVACKVGRLNRIKISSQQIDIGAHTSHGLGGSESVCSAVAG